MPEVETQNQLRDWNLLKIPRYTVGEAENYLGFRGRYLRSARRPALIGDIPSLDPFAPGEETWLGFDSLAFLFVNCPPLPGLHYVLSVHFTLDVIRPQIELKIGPGSTRVRIEVAIDDPLTWSKREHLITDLNWAIASGRVEIDGDRPVRLYPFTRGRFGAGEPKLIAIDPRYGHGKPIFADSRIRIDALTARFRAGESIAAIADDTDIPTEHIEEAIRFESSFQPLFAL